MFPATSPQKRKHNSEYRDPDYEEIRGSANKRPYEEPTRSIANATVATSATTTAAAESRLARVCQIISREFQTEIALKQQQLEEIEQRLLQARNLLDRLRYAIVADYYRKQELPLSAADAAAVRGKSTLFDEEPLGPQMALHPSLKKIIGKQPRSYTDILGRTCPERAAAQNAMHTIRARTQAKRRQERRLQQLIREQGLVIDHSKDVAAEMEASVAAFQSKQTITQVAHSSPAQLTANEDKKTTATRGALNATRLNNKIKHIIVIGNTSKYIGGDVDGEQEQKPFGHVLSHKWLVYVQSKEHETPLENFVKKVRFFLHPSYRPNDIVDITTPPFQIARRGWGEFPVRIQLVFHEHLQQKPVQLVHNLVLDKTLSGLQTMGAETLMEIWLRDMGSATQSSASNVLREIASTTENQEPVETSNKTRTISFTQNKEELDDNLFAFLNKIETTPAAICADIEKIQPTVVVTEPLAGIGSSPTKAQISISNSATPIKPVSTVCSNGVIPAAVLQKKVVQLVDSTGKVKYVQMLVATAARGQSNGTLQAKTIAPIQSTTITSVSNTTQSTNRTMPTTATSTMLSTNTNLSHTKPVAGILHPTKNAISPSIAAAVPPVTQPLNNNCLAGSNTVSGKPLNTAKNVVFQKEGKLYIIDPLQMKLKQQQKKQVSLLKPQISLLKQQQTQNKHQNNHNQPQLSQSFVIQSIASDHDYTPIRIPFIAASNVVAKQSHSIPITTVAAAKPKNNTTPVTPALHLGIKQTRAKAGNIFELQQRQRIQYECHFQQRRCSSMLAAVEFLLRRLPIIAPKQSTVAAFPFVCHSAAEFQALPALKQRACEWLRAKCVTRFMRNHKDLQQLDANGNDKFWSTREVVIFARQHAYTPIVKALTIPQSTEIDNKKQPQFAQLVKNEVKQEQQQFQYDTLTVHTPVASWVNEVWESTRRYEDTVSESGVIDVINVDEMDERESKKTTVTTESLQKRLNAEHIYLPAPEHLEVESELVTEMCRDIGIRLQAEEITAGVLQPMAQTVLAHSLHIFIERLLRRAAAVKLQQKEKAVSEVASVDMYVDIERRDIGKAIATFAEFDFLRNCYLGIGKYEKE